MKNLMLLTCIAVLVAFIVASIAAIPSTLKRTLIGIFGSPRPVAPVSQPPMPTYEQSQRIGQQLRAPMMHAQRERQRAHDEQVRQDRAEIQQFVKQQRR